MHVCVRASKCVFVCSHESVRLRVKPGSHATFFYSVFVCAVLKHGKF